MKNWLTPEIYLIELIDTQFSESRHPACFAWHSHTTMAKILIIDDDRLVSSCLALVTSADGHETRTASDGIQGVEIAREFLPAVVFVDLLMPERAGLETMVALRAEVPEARLIAMTGQPMVGEVSLLDLAKRFGAHGVLAKPFTVDQISALVKDVATS